MTYNYFLLIKEKQSASYIDDTSVNIKQNDVVATFKGAATAIASSINDADNEDHSKSAPISVKRILANLLPGSSFQPLKLPFSEDEHFILNCDSSYYISEKDLSSIVAFTLSSKDYKEFQLNANKKTVPLVANQNNNSIANKTNISSNSLNNSNATNGNSVNNIKKYNSSSVSSNLNSKDTHSIKDLNPAQDVGMYFKLKYKTLIFLKTTFD